MIYSMCDQPVSQALMSRCIAVNTHFRHPVTHRTPGIQALHLCLAAWSTLDCDFKVIFLVGFSASHLCSFPLSPVPFLSTSLSASPFYSVIFLFSEMTNSESLGRGVCMWETFIYTALISLGLLTQAAGMQRLMCVPGFTAQRRSY